MIPIDILRNLKTIFFHAINSKIQKIHASSRKNSLVTPMFGNIEKNKILFTKEKVDYRFQYEHLKNLSLMIQRMCMRN